MHFGAPRYAPRSPATNGRKPQRAGRRLLRRRTLHSGAAHLRQRQPHHPHRSSQGRQAAPRRTAASWKRRRNSPISAWPMPGARAHRTGRPDEDARRAARQRAWTPWPGDRGRAGGSRRQGPLWPVRPPNDRRR
jgi:hypothetical protein